MSQELQDALDTMLAERPVARLNRRLQAAIDQPTLDAIEAVAASLADGGDPSELRSQAVRYMLRRGAEAIRKDTRRQALARGGATA
jgi:hypothetical protein